MPTKEEHLAQAEYWIEHAKTPEMRDKAEQMKADVLNTVDATPEQLKTLRASGPLGKTRKPRARSLLLPPRKSYPKAILLTVDPTLYDGIKSEARFQARSMASLCRLILQRAILGLGPVHE